LTADLERALATGSQKIVLDNTYVSRKSRAEVLQSAAAHGVAVRCVWLQTSVDDAQVNVATRLIEEFGRLPDDPPFFPTVQFRYQRDLEPPDLNEGFEKIDVVPFVRRVPADYTNRAVVVWCDDVDHALAKTLNEYRDRGYLILGLSWQPGVADPDFSRVRELIGFPIEIESCPHGAGPPRCWCRKPLPGLGVLLIHRHRLDPAQCIYIGGGNADPGFARKLGFAYRHPITDEASSPGPT
jgi:hypothetical protein